jgi:hypothetical protein
MTNYRPISPLTVFSTVLEKVMYSRLSHHMHTNNILVPEQFGFRQGICTENGAFKLTDSVLKSVNQKMHVVGILCYLAEAFIKFCWLNYIFMAFNEQCLTGSNIIS